MGESETQGRMVYGPSSEAVAVPPEDRDAAWHAAARRAGAQRRLGALPVVAALLAALNFGRLHELTAGTGLIPIGKILIPLGVLLLLLQNDLGRRLRVLATPQGKAFGLLVTAMLLSIPTSLWPGGSFTEATHFVYSIVPAVVIMATAAISERELSSMLRALVAAATVLGMVVTLGGGMEHAGRATATTTYDPNDMAMVGAVSFPLAIWMLAERSRLWRLIGVLGAAMGILIVVKSASRGGTVALACVVLAMFFLYRRSIPRRWRYISAGLVALGLFAAPPVFWTRIATLEDPGEDYNVTAKTGRLEIWKRGVGYFVRNPLTGVGLAQFRTAEGFWARERNAGEGWKWSAGHNMYVETAAELGTPGLVGFLGMFVPTLIWARRARRLRRVAPFPPSLARIGDALALALVAFFIAGIFLSMEYSPPAMSLGAVGMAYTHLVRTAAAQVGYVAVAPASARAGARDRRTAGGRGISA